MVELAGIKKKYEKFAGALDEVAATGYGIVMPTMEELHLEEPEIMKQGGATVCGSRPARRAST